MVCGMFTMNASAVPNCAGELGHKNTHLRSKFAQFFLTKGLALGSQFATLLLCLVSIWELRSAAQ